MTMITTRSFGTIRDGREATLFEMRTASGVVMTVTDFGAAWVSGLVPDACGRIEDVVLGFDSAADYERESGGFGCVIGRFANRIGDASYALDGKHFQLPKNKGELCLHSGATGFSHRLWKGRIENDSVIFEIAAEDGDAGFGGYLWLQARYTLHEEGKLCLEYRAMTSEPTPINVTNHVYFNLNGHLDSSVHDHVCTFNAPWMTTLAETMLPTGEILSVKGGPFDFLSPKSIGEDIQADHDQIRIGGGYDHNLILAKAYVGEFSWAARIEAPRSGRRLDVYTTEPAMQFYTGLFGEHAFPAKGGASYSGRCSFCLETQHFPDSVHFAHFPSTILRPGTLWESKTEYHFALNEETAC